MTLKRELSDKISLNESVLVVLYFVLYIVYLFVTMENELAHWLSLVVLPFFLIYLYQKINTENSTFAATLVSIGISIKTWRNGIWVAVFLGLGISLLQLIISESAAQILEIFASGKFLFYMPLVFIMLLLTAGFTEEFFFRGILQTRLQVLTGSNIWAIIITAICFGVYHLPYAYFSPDWPTNGDFFAALGSSLLQGGIGGVILGWLYVKSGNNLVACIITHSLMDLLPGMTMIHFDG